MADQEVVLAVAMMQRDEGPLLAAWIEHYLSLTDPQFISIVDNGSSDVDTLSILEDAKKRGIVVCREFSTREHFEQKGGVIKKILRRYAGKANVFLPCDCDEFLVTTSIDSFKNVDVTRQELQRLQNNTNYIVRINKYFFNEPSNDSYYFDRANKSIYFNRSPHKLSLGFHLGQGIGFIENTLAFFHFHNKSLPLLLRRARFKMSERLPDFAKETLENYSGSGGHLCRYFLRTETEIRRSARRSYVKDFSSADLSPALVRAQEACKGAGLENASIVVESLKTPFNHSKNRDITELSVSEADFFFFRTIGCQSYADFGISGETVFAAHTVVGPVTSFFFSKSDVPAGPLMDQLQPLLDKKRILSLPLNASLGGGKDFEGSAGQSAPQGPFDFLYINAAWPMTDLEGISRHFVSSRSIIIILESVLEQHRDVVSQYFDVVQVVGTLSVLKPKDGAARV